MKRAIAVCLLTTLATAAVIRADEGWAVTTANFGVTAAVPTAMDAKGLTVKTTAGPAETKPWADVIRVGRPARPASPTGLVLCTADGQRIVGMPVRVDGPNLIWRTDENVDIPVALESVLAILRNRTQDQALSQTRAEDQATLLTGDVVRGIVTDASADAVTFTPAAGEPVKVPPASIASVLFASPPGGRKAATPRSFLVRVGASVFCGDEVTLADGRLTLRVAPGVDLGFPLANVQFVEHTGGPVAWLSSRLPSESTQTPYLDGDRPARFDTTVAGDPIRFGGVIYDHGIGVHSRSKIVFAVGPGDRTFRTRYAIDGPLARADVDVRVLVDGKVVHEKIGFKAGTLSPVIEADLNGATTLTLEVDYGRGYDVQDRLNWIEPAIVR